MAAPAWVGMSSVIETTGAGDRTESIEITASDLPSGCPADARLFLLIDQYSWGASASHTSPAAPWESWWDGSIGVPVGPNTREFEVWTCRRVDAALPVSIEFTWPAGTSGGANLFAEGIGRLRIAAWERSVLIDSDAMTGAGVPTNVDLVVPPGGSGSPWAPSTYDAPAGSTLACWSLGMRRGQVAALGDQVEAADTTQRYADGILHLRIADREFAAADTQTGGPTYTASGNTVRSRHQAVLLGRPQSGLYVGRAGGVIGSGGGLVCF